MGYLVHSTASAFVKHTSSNAFVIQVIAATNIVISGHNVLDSDPSGTVVGTVSATFSEGAVSVQWSLTNTASGKYAINANTGVVTVAAGLTAGTDTITVQVTQGSKAPATQDITINVALETIATNIVFSPITLSDLAAIGTSPGTASTTDGLSYVWSLTANPGGRWAINASTGVVTVATGLVAGTDTITIRIAFGTKTYSQSFGIIVAVPTVSSISLPNHQVYTSAFPGAIITIAHASGTNLGLVTFTIPSGQDSGGLVTIDSNGTLRAGSIALIVGTYAIQITASPLGGSPVTSSFNIGVVAGGTTLTLDSVTLTAYQAAIAIASLGAKRIAGGQAVVSALGKAPTLSLLQDGTIQASIVFTGALIFNFDGTNIWLSLPTVSLSTTTTADLMTGLWSFQVANGSAMISGTAGLDSSYMLTLTVTSFVADTTGFDSSLTLVLPTSLDTGASVPTLSWVSFANTTAGAANTATYYFSGGQPTGLTATLAGSALSLSNFTLVQVFGSGSTETGVVSFAFANPAAGTYALVAHGTGTFASTAPAVSLITA